MNNSEDSVMSETTATPHGDNGATTTATQEKLTPFEERYADLKTAKFEARQKQSEVSRIGNELVELQKKAKEAEQSHKRALSKVDVLKEGLEALFSSEMRNY